VREKYFALGILLIVIIAIAIPISYFIADSVVYDAINHKFGLIGSGSIQIGLKDVSFAGNFNFTNRADIPLTVDYANLTVCVFDSDLPYDGGLFFIGSVVQDHEYTIGSAIVENELLPAKGQFQFPIGIDVTSDDALNVIRNGNYSAGYVYSEMTLSGTYLFWHFTQQMLIW